MTISNSTLQDNARGLLIDLNSTTGGADVVIDDTIISGSDVFGFSGANTGGSPLNVSVSDSTLAHNATGITLNGGQARLDIAHSIFSSNGVAKTFLNGALGRSPGDNIFSNNSNNGPAFGGVTTEQ